MNYNGSMADDNQIDEVVLTLLADGVDAPTALAAAYRPPANEQPAAGLNWLIAFVMLGSFIAFIVWMFT